MKKIITLFSIILFNMVNSQMGINTENPKQTLHIDGKLTTNTSNPSIGEPSYIQQQDDVVITKEGKVGLGIIKPTTNLDVNGKTIIRKINNLNGDNIKPLYIDNTGLVGKTKLEINTAIASYKNYNKISIPNIQAYNNGQEFIIPISENQAIVNTINSVITSEGYLKINEEGIYLLSGSVSNILNLNSSTLPASVAITLNVSKDNGATWNFVTGGNSVFPNTGINISREFAYTIPSMIENLKPGNLIKISLSRGVSTNGQIEGAILNSLIIGSDYTAPSYTLTVIKL